MTDRKMALAWAEQIDELRPIAEAAWAAWESAGPLERLARQALLEQAECDLLTAELGAVTA